MGKSPIQSLMMANILQVSHYKLGLPVFQSLLSTPDSIGHRTAAKNRCAQSIWGLNFGQTKHEIACRNWNHW